jgi:hypothetical protein
MVALSATLMVVYQICAAEHDIFLFSEMTLAFFQIELCLSQQCLPQSFLGILSSTLLTDGLNPFYKL